MILSRLVAWCCYLPISRTQIYARRGALLHVDLANNVNPRQALFGIGSGSLLRFKSVTTGKYLRIKKEKTVDCSGWSPSPSLISN